MRGRREGGKAEVECNTMQCNALQCGGKGTQCNAVQQDAVQRNATQRSAMCCSELRAWGVQVVGVPSDSELALQFELEVLTMRRAPPQGQDGPTTR